MDGTKLISAFCLAGVLASVQASAQQAPRQPYDGSASPSAPPQEIHIDQDCRILPGATQIVPGKKAKPFNDKTICHLESVATSEHMEERIVGNELYRSRVHIAEQQFVLQNIADYPVVFIVEQAVPANWMVDSDPQPSEFDGATAVFPVLADPGAIVRLHVGLRNDKPLKPKVIKTSFSARQGTAED